METSLELLLGALAAIFLAAWWLGILLGRLRIPVVIGPLFLGILTNAFGWEPAFLADPRLGDLGDLGVASLLFVVGLELDLGSFRRLRGITGFTVASIVLPWFFGWLVAIGAGYGEALAVFVGMTRVPVAEGVVVPILDEFRLVHTRIGRYTIGTGVIDDLVELVLIVVASAWAAREGGPGESLVEVLMWSALFGGLVGLTRLGAEPLVVALPQRPPLLVLAGMGILFVFAFVAEHADLGMALGALAAGVLFRAVLERRGEVGRQGFEGIAVIAYGLLGPIFFFQVGHAVEFAALRSTPWLTLGLFGAAFLGKLLAPAVLLVQRAVSCREALAIGIATNARMTTELVVAQLLYAYHVIDAKLFAALVAASSISTVVVPLALALILRSWGDALRRVEEAGLAGGEG